MSGLAESLGVRRCDAPVGLINSVTHSKIIPCFSLSWNDLAAKIMAHITGKSSAAVNPRTVKWASLVVDHC
jgi:hypothetical protein